MRHQQNCRLSPDSRIFIVSSNLWSKLQNTACFFRYQDELAFAKILFWLINWLYLSLKHEKGTNMRLQGPVKNPTFIVLAFEPLEIVLGREKDWE